MSDHAINIQHVSKTYRGRVRALDDVDFQVNRGEIFGLLGPNGAGKSTLVKILMTIVGSDRVDGTVLGQPVGHRRTLRKVGYLPEDHSFPRYLKGREVLSYYGGLAGVPRKDRVKRVPELLEKVGMADWGATPVSRYSKGMMQRVGLAQALMNDPELLFLDEPTDGVDPVGRREIREPILALKEAGHTIFINSHLLSELEMLCDRVALLVKGKVLRSGTLDELMSGSARYEIEVEGLAPKWAAEIEGLEVGAATAPGRSVLAVKGMDAGRANEVIDRLRGEGRLIHRVAPVRESLEDFFVREVGSGATGGTQS